MMVKDKQKKYSKEFVNGWNEALLALARKFSGSSSSHIETSLLRVWLKNLRFEE
jgi:hypothetical protein